MHSAASSSAPAWTRPVAWSFLLLTWLLLALPLSAQRTREYDLKAVFLFNFATFVEWPDEAKLGEGDAFVIGVLGDDPFGASLDEVVNGEAVRGAPLVVRRYRTVAEAAGARILFMALPPDRLREALAALRGRPVLTVSDHPQFLEAGGIVAFSTGARVELHINPEAAREAGLSISSKLLRVAKIHAKGAGP